MISSEDSAIICTEDWTFSIKGVPHVNGQGRGDLILHIKVLIPAKLTREQRRLFEELLEQLPAENQPSEKGILERVRDYFTQ